MDVFSEAYLEEVIENQGKLFEYAEEHCPGIDVADFIEAYMKSRTRALIDEGQAYVSTMETRKSGQGICAELDWSVLCIVSMVI